MYDEHKTNNVRVSQDLRCTQCWYSLHGISADKICPECAQPVRRSILDNPLYSRSPFDLRTMAIGLLYCWWAIVAALAGVVVYLLPVVATSLSVSRWHLFCALLSITAHALLVLGVWRFTVSDPAALARHAQTRGRSLLRTTVVLGLIGAVVAGLPRVGLTYSTVEKVALLLDLPTVVGIYLLFRGLRDLARCASNEVQAHLTSRLMHGIPVAMIMGVVGTALTGMPLTHHSLFYIAGFPTHSLFIGGGFVMRSALITGSTLALAGVLAACILGVVGLSALRTGISTLRGAASAA